jgi:hypothetical protein
MITLKIGVTGGEILGEFFIKAGESGFISTTGKWTARIQAFIVPLTD